jgi:hypothetical protein
MEPRIQDAKTSHEALLAYYTAPGVFTSVGGFEEQVDAIPDDIASVAAAVQGLLIHEAWAPAYGVTPAPERLAEKELHSAIAMLSRATSMNARPLAEPRPAEQRVVGVCRHFATLFVAIMRRKGVPTRARCGFANYFEAGKNGDHWVGEYWNREEQRWVLVDEQLDELQRSVVKPGFDTLDVPRDRFLVAGDAWRLCRSGAADPLTFGVGGTNMWGLIEVFGDIFQDLAALQNIELLPWGWYGLAKDHGALDAESELIDRLATLSSAADATALRTLRDLVAGDERLRVPEKTLAAIIATDRARVASG